MIYVYNYDICITYIQRVYMLTIEKCMGMENAGIPSLPWDSQGNGNQIT